MCSAWLLCCVDEVLGRNFSHHRAWIEKPIISLAEILSVSVYGDAVMRNHYHIELSVETVRSAQWSDEEISDQWLSLCPGRIPKELAPDMLASIELAVTTALRHSLPDFLFDTDPGANFSKFITERRDLYRLDVFRLASRGKIGTLKSRNMTTSEIDHPFVILCS